MNNKNTVSVIKADVGRFEGHSIIHDDLIKTAIETFSDRIIDVLEVILE